VARDSDSACRLISIASAGELGGMHAGRLVVLDRESVGGSN